MTRVLELEKEYDVNEGTFEYPFLLIEGLGYEIEFNYFKNAQSGDMPLYIKLNDEFLRLGTADLNHIFFMNLKRISNGSYKLYLYIDENNFKEIDYMDYHAALSALKVR